MRVEQKPNGWRFPIVTGHRYRLHWAEGIDVERMDISIGQKWEETDDSVYLMTNFTDVRASINLTTSGGELIANETFINTPASEHLMGDNVVYN
jgi:hypothetical protein